MNRPIGYIDVDRLQAETTLQEAAAKCGFPLEVKSSGAEVRIDCPFGCPCDHSGRKEIAINAENPQKIFQCHSYVCGFRGNLLTLMHGFLTGTKPTGGKLKGDDFQRVKKVLVGTGQPVVNGSAPAAGTSDSPASSNSPTTFATAPPPENSAASEHATHRFPRRPSPRTPQYRRKTHPRRRRDEPRRSRLHPPSSLPDSRIHDQVAL